MIKIVIVDVLDCVWDLVVLIENNSIFLYFKSFEMNFMIDSLELLLLEKFDEIVWYINEYLDCWI